MKKQAILIFCIILFISSVQLLFAQANTASDDVSNTGRKFYFNDNSNYVSPETAFYTSLIPVWSGSWLVEFGGTGCLLQPLKLFGTAMFVLGCIVVATAPFDDSYNSREARAEAASWGFLSILIGGVIYVPSAIYDAKQSRELALDYNYELRKYEMRKHEGKSSKIYVKPFFVCSNNSEVGTTRVEGMGIVFSRKI